MNLQIILCFLVILLIFIIDCRSNKESLSNKEEKIDITSRILACSKYTSYQNHPDGSGEGWHATCKYNEAKERCECSSSDPNIKVLSFKPWEGTKPEAVYKKNIDKKMNLSNSTKKQCQMGEEICVNSHCISLLHKPIQEDCEEDEGCVHKYKCPEGYFPLEKNQCESSERSC